jgi:hypothetical protein
MIEEFEDIRPYYDHEVQTVIQKLIKDEQFLLLAKFIWPDITITDIENKANRVKSAFDFQVEFMHGAIHEIINRSSSGLTFSGFENIDRQKPYLFISNHRDIMLDSAILQTLLVDEGHQTTEITFGNNLMTPGFITEFGRINRMFTVQREGNSKELYNISRKLSAYIRHTIKDKKVSIWIAQRNGRTKDGNDITQTGLLKMLNISNPGNLVQGFKEMNIIPMTISYEYEPCDFLKARETYLSSLHTIYKKDPDEDLKSIVAGITNFKGRIHLSLGKFKDEELDTLNKFENDNEKIKQLSGMIDAKICSGYRLFKTNYIAFDLINNTRQYSEHYTEIEKSEFESYINKGLDYLDMNTPEVRILMLNIYSNPLKQKINYASASL